MINFFSKHTFLRNSSFLGFIFLICFSATAQTPVSNSTNSSADDIEGTVDSISSVLEKNLPSSDEVLEDDEMVTNTLKKGTAKDRADYNKIRSNDFQSNLGIVQKNFLTKTGRIELFGGLSMVPTEVFYRTFGGQLNAGYHFNEAWAINGLGYFFSSTPRGEIDDLRKTNEVKVDNLIYLKSYYALSAYWNPIYGKMTYFNQNITPFEIFFTAGAGRVRTQAASENFGIHLGMGNTFYLSRNSGVRLDLNWVFYQTKDINNRNQNANSLMLTLGYSGFYPENTER